MTLRFECQNGNKVQKLKLLNIWVKRNDNGDMLCFKKKNDKSPHFYYIFLDEIKPETISITED